MKKILILYPHFPPSNLAGVHRPRLFAQHLPAFGWDPTVLTVHEDHYEEALDHNLVKLLPTELRIVKVSAGPRLGPIGDIGLRAFSSLYKKGKELIKTEKFDFLFIPIPSFYCALLGRRLHAATGIKYGIDYIDPWVHEFAGSKKKLSRAWWSTKLANFLEPIAIKNASLITGVAEGYYLPVLQRNKHLLANAVYGAMPYGGEKKDHLAVQEMQDFDFLFKKTTKLQLVYAGALLPKAMPLLKIIFDIISKNFKKFEAIEFHFIGTGTSHLPGAGFKIKPIAEETGLWEKVVFEYPSRLPYLEVLAHLSRADAAFILGSTEAHYTPSKVYQAILAERPVFAVLHTQSQAVQVVQSSGMGHVLDFNGEAELDKLQDFANQFLNFAEDVANNKFYLKDPEIMEATSAWSVTQKLAGLLTESLKK